MPIVKEELWADAEGNAVPFGDPRGKTVLVGAGREISDEDAAKYGLTEPAKPEPQHKPEPETGEKAIAAPPETKAVKSKETK